MSVAATEPTSDRGACRGRNSFLLQVSRFAAVRLDGPPRNSEGLAVACLPRARQPIGYPLAPPRLDLPIRQRRVSLLAHAQGSGLAKPTGFLNRGLEFGFANSNPQQVFSQDRPGTVGVDRSSGPSAVPARTRLPTVGGVCRSGQACPRSLKRCRWFQWPDKLLASVRSTDAPTKYTRGSIPFCILATLEPCTVTLTSPRGASHPHREKLTGPRVARIRRVGIRMGETNPASAEAILIVVGFFAKGRDLLSRRKLVSIYHFPSARSQWPPDRSDRLGRLALPRLRVPSRRGRSRSRSDRALPEPFPLNPARPPA